MNGIDLIGAERERQKNVKGYDEARDAAYVNGELAGAGACFALTGAEHWMRDQVIAKFWPWPSPQPKAESDRIVNLTKAGALIAAELDRLLQIQKADDKGIYLADWSDKEGVLRDFFRLPYIEKADRAKIEADTASVEILLAYYLYEDYSGEAFVLFRQNGKLYEVNASHCSCYGLEDQWQPEESDVMSLRHRLDNGRLGQDYDENNKYANELRAVLNGIAPVAIAA